MFKSKTLSLITLLLFANTQLSNELFARTQTQKAILPRPISYARGVVVSRSQIASEIGARVMQEGGNAFDAAIATGYALSVINPKDSGIGGGGFALVYEAKTKKLSVIDFRETAPVRINQSSYQFLKGPKAAAVPGTVAGYEYIREHFGKLDRNALIEPSIELAEDGFEVTKYYRNAIEDKKAEFSLTSREVFLPKGKVPQVGDKIRQPALAKTLRLIADRGAQEFYEGTIAKQIAKSMAQQGGLIQLIDLKGYEVEKREALCGTYRELYRICSAPPPSAGGLVLVEALNILENFNLPKYDYNSPQRLHYVIEAMKFAFADRATQVGDPAFNPIMIKPLLTKELGRERALRIQKAGKAIPSDQILTTESLEEEVSQEKPETTHFTASDREGNVITITVSLNGRFGSGYIEPGTGILLNNTLDDFSRGEGKKNQYGLVAGKLNLPYPRKRPLSSITPTVVFETEDDQPILALGAPGGPTISNAVLNVLLAFLDHRMTLNDSIEAGRVHHQWMPDYVFGERNLLTPEVKSELRERYGYKTPPEDLELWRRFYWTVEAIAFDPKTGSVEGVSDARAEQGLAYD
ncbi:MAG: gamma-glutamyltransferase [Candidatus Caenarcaniphilales bacterium]|nr:gamma-glutamyltransferase [Candidatus Caenarcaniphilales bacterium]